MTRNQFSLRGGDNSSNSVSLGKIINTWGQIAEKILTNQTFAFSLLGMIDCWVPGYRNWVLIKATHLWSWLNACVNFINSNYSVCKTFDWVSLIFSLFIAQNKRNQNVHLATNVNMGSCSNSIEGALRVFYYTVCWVDT